MQTSLKPVVADQLQGAYYRFKSERFSLSVAQQVGDRLSFFRLGAGQHSRELESCALRLQLQPQPQPETQVPPQPQLPV